MTETFKFEIPKVHGIVVVCVIVTIALVILMSMAWCGGYESGKSTSVPTFSTPVPTSVITPTPTSSTSVITFTAIYCTVSSGQYQVLTTDGRILIFGNYEQWDQVIPQGVYIGETTNGIVTSAHQIAYRNDERPYVVGRDSYYGDGYYDDKYYYDRYKYHTNGEYDDHGNKCIFDHCG